MATDPVPPRTLPASTNGAPEALGPVPVVPAENQEEAEVIQASIKVGSIAQVVVAIVAVLGLLYIAKTVMVTTFVALLLAFMLEPVVKWLSRLHVPRWLGALVAVMLLLAVVGALTYFFYSRAVSFAEELPKYSGKIRATLAKLQSQTSKIEENTKSAIIPPQQKGQQQALKVQVQETPGISHLLSAGSGVVEGLLAASFVPFLVYFMLTWKDHAHAATVKLFPKEHRMTAHRTIARISEMIRAFIVGNVVVGLVNAAISVLVFWLLHIQYFYFVGVISGFVSIIPYLGVFLALLPPLASGIGTLDRTGVLIVILTVVGLHIVSMNVLYPKLVGKRLRLNPLAVTLALLFWAWIWGAWGLILAVPIVGATKVICDHVESLQGLGEWLGE